MHSFNFIGSSLQHVIFDWIRGKGWQGYGDFSGSRPGDYPASGGADIGGRAFYGAELYDRQAVEWHDFGFWSNGPGQAPCFTQPIPGSLFPLPAGHQELYPAGFKAPECIIFKGSGLYPHHELI